MIPIHATAPPKKGPTVLFNVANVASPGHWPTKWVHFLLKVKS